MTTASQAMEAGALVVTEPELGCLVVTGPDRKSWLNGIVSCDVGKVATGIGQWGLALTKQGKIQSELFVIESADTLYVATSPQVAAELSSMFDRMLVMEDAELSDRSSELGFVFVHGPRAADLASSVAPLFEATWGAIDVTGLGGAALVVARPKLEALAVALAEAGGDLALRPSPEDWERERIARGVPRFGVDYDSKDNPHEAALDQRAVSWTKGCYLGQEVVCMQDMRGKVKRRVASIEIDGALPPAPGSSVECDGEPVGEVTSSAAGDDARHAVALARMRTPFDEPGRALSVGGRSARVRI